MTPVTLVSTFTNPNRRRRQVCGILIGRTSEWWVVRTPDEDRNQVLPFADWERQ